MIARDLRQQQKKEREREWVKNNIIRREGGVSAAAESIRSA